MAYHISYEKVKSYEMPEDNFKTAATWKKQVLKSYRDLRAYKKLLVLHIGYNPHP